jgi:serine/threonine-protein kinase
MKNILRWLFWVGLYVLLPLIVIVKMIWLLFWLGIIIAVVYLFNPRYVRRLWDKSLPFVRGTRRRLGEAMILVVLFIKSLLSRLVEAMERLLGWLRSKFPDVRPEACPPVDRLKDLLADHLPAEDHAKVAAHLEVCSACQYRVEGLTAGQRSWPGMARKLSVFHAAPEPALRKVMARLKESNDLATGDEPGVSANLPLNFLSPPEKPGQIGRLERYEVLEEIGRGGMGVVLKAFDPSLHRVVAIKVLAPQLATSGVARKRFLREAKAAAAVTHDHIVTIHAVDEANGLPYLVMQFVAGQSLQDRLDKDGPLELTEILRIGTQTASGLAAAHAHGIVHRDIKPANILLEEGVQRVRITDFGLARAMDDASLTQSGFVAGSPLYMAPEQARGEALDHRADLFSLGSVLYTMCTGRPPFRAANTLGVLRRVTDDAPRPIRETNPEIPDWLAEVVTKLMAKEPAERFQSAAEVEEILGRHLAQLQHAAWVPPRSPAPPVLNDLPTSLTICPTCGASLQIPERMVGSLLHCPECGKPFHVEEGSEVIQVARPAHWPLGQHRRRLRWFRHGGCAIIVFAGFFFLFVFGLSVAFYQLGESHRQPPQTTIKMTKPGVPTTEAVKKGPSQPLKK